MMRLAALIAGTIGAALLLWTRSVQAGEKEMSLREIFDKWGNQYGVDPLLLEAFATVESGLDANAVRWNPPKDISVGLMQVLYIPSNINVPNSPPTNRFNVDGWSEATFDKLKDPEFNVRIASQIVAWNVKTFGMPRAIAVYNNYSQRFAGVNGPFTNQSYVDKVLRNYARLQ